MSSRRNHEHIGYKNPVRMYAVESFHSKVTISIISTLDTGVLIFYSSYRSFYASLETIISNDERRII